MAQRSLVVMAPFFPVLVALGLWQRLWDSLHSLLLPVFSVYDTIDPDTLTISAITAQFIKSVLSLGALVGEMWRAVVMMVMKPFGEWGEDVQRVLEELRLKHEQAVEGARQEKREGQADSEGKREQKEERHADSDVPQKQAVEGAGQEKREGQADSEGKREQKEERHADSDVPQKQGNDES